MNSYLRAFAVVVSILLLVAAFLGGYVTRGWKAGKEASETESALLANQLNNINKQLELQAQGQEKLDKRLSSLPKKDAIREIVHANPSGCDIPAAVADELRKQADQAERARSSP